jgi:hypothetical protein
LKDGSLVWRVGHISAPLDFTPWEVLERLGWKHRFDHPDKLFRTLYCAEQRKTALREVVSDFRPNTKARLDFKKTFGQEHPAPQITAGFRENKGLAQGILRVSSGNLVNVDDPSLRHRFEQLNAELLVQHGMDHLDITQIRSKDRPVTQAFTRFIAGLGAAGALYGSNLDNQPCAALFEGRAFLIPVSGSTFEPLTASHPDLVAVCGELGLVLGD